jgi:endonuclease YncB( thermonuclease family)
VRWLRDGFIFILLMTFGILIAARLENANEARYSGTFFAIDGDTLSSQGERFRLVGIDAPELAQSCERGGEAWACGRQARETMQAFLDAGLVQCLGNDRDKYRRVLVRCSVSGLDLGAEMVSAGLAVTTEYFLFAEEQASAQKRGMGIWGGPFDQPRDWRREHKAAEMDAPGASIIAAIRHLLGW